MGSYPTSPFPKLGASKAATHRDGVIEEKELTKTFGKLKAVDNVDFNVEQGEVLGLLGPNGADKTTTVSTLCTILKPTDGTASVNDFDVVLNLAPGRQFTPCTMIS